MKTKKKTFKNIFLGSASWKWTYLNIFFSFRDIIRAKTWFSSCKRWLANNMTGRANNMTGRAAGTAVNKGR